MFKKTTPIVRKLTAQEASMIAAHQAWLDSGSGQRTDLSEHDFSKTDLSQVDLRGAVLVHCSFAGADLSKAQLGDASVRGNPVSTDLTQADFTGATMTACDLHSADIHHAEFHDAALRDADLSGVHGALAVQFSGADLNGATLPESLEKFEALPIVKDAAEYSRSVFIAMLAACVYSWLTIATTTDLHMLENSASSPLPFISTSIPTGGFYIAAPLILFAVYIYFHLNLQRLWELLVTLPAVLTDGRPLDQAADPWLTVGLVRTHLRNLRTSPRPLGRLQYFISATVAWWMVPFTLLWFWLRYLTRQDWRGSLVLVLLSAVSIPLGAVFQRMTRVTLRSLPNRNGIWSYFIPILAGVAIFCALFVVTAGTIGLLLRGPKVVASQGDEDVIERDPIVITKLAALFGIKPVDGELVKYETGWSTQKESPRPEDAQSWTGRLFEFLHYQPHVDLRGQEVSTKPLSWFRNNEPIDLVVGVDLHRTRLRYLSAWSAFLARANFTSTDLMGAQFRYADLSDADLNGSCLAWSSLAFTNLHNAKLNEADLGGAVLTAANLEGAEFVRADFTAAIVPTGRITGANFSGAKFNGADIGMPMSRAVFTGADFGGANLQASDLDGANLIDAVNLSAEQVRAARGWHNALLPFLLLKDLGLPPNHNSATLKNLEEKIAKDTSKNASKPIWWERRADLESAVRIEEDPGLDWREPATGKRQSDRSKASAHSSRP